MKNLVHFVSVAVFSFSLLWGEAQNSPTWISANIRELNYSPEVYFSEFTQGNLQEDESVSSLLERLKVDAKRGAAGNIRTLIESQIEKTDRQVTEGKDFSFFSLYQDYTRQSVQADLVGLKTESYFDEKAKWGYAFAYVKKIELVEYYKAQISLQLQQVENALNVATTATNAGQKMQAKLRCEAALLPITKVEFAQDLLSAIVPYDVDGLQLDRLTHLKNELFQQLITLEQSVYVFIQCNETNMDKPVKIFEPELKKILSNNQCSFTTDQNQADYIITATASTRPHDGNLAFGDGFIKFSLADVNVELYSNYKKMQVYNGEVSQKNNGDGASFESAGRNALKLAASTVWTEIKPWILGK
mgnify:CR=1 FL=1